MRLDKEKGGLSAASRDHYPNIASCWQVTVLTVPSGVLFEMPTIADEPTQFSYVENDNPITFFDFFLSRHCGVSGTLSSRLWSSPVCSMSSSRPELFPPPLQRPAAARGKEAPCGSGPDPCLSVCWGLSAGGGRTSLRAYGGQSGSGLGVGRVVE